MKTRNRTRNRAAGYLRPNTDSDIAYAERLKVWVQDGIYNELKHPMSSRIADAIATAAAIAAKKEYLRIAKRNL